jgi:hypothetical protein
MTGVLETMIAKRLLLAAGLVGSVTMMSAALPVSDSHAQLNRVRPAPAPAGRPAWFAEAEGRQIGVWGAPGNFSWRIAGNGRGTLSLLSRPRIGGARMIDRPFALTVPEHVRFAGLIERFTGTPQDDGLCATDQAQDIIQWRGGSRAAGLFNFDHGCRDAANMARLQLYTDAITILREAAERQAAS